MSSVIRLQSVSGGAMKPELRDGPKKPSKFDLIVSSGLITQKELEAAAQEAREKKIEIESILMEKHKIAKREIGKSLSAYYQCPFVDFKDVVVIPPELIKNISLNYLKANYWVPLRRDADTVDILIDNPHSLQMIQDIKRFFQVKDIKIFVGLREDIRRVIILLTSDVDPYFGKSSISDILIDLVTEHQGKNEEDTEPLIDENDSAIVRLANQIIIDAYEREASDIHIEPYSDRSETRIRFRVDGNCYEYQKIPAAYRRALASRFKIMARLDIAERRRPQDGKIRFRMPHGDIEIRVATVPTSGGADEDVVMRILTASEPMPLDKLKMSERNLTQFKGILEKPYGIILCVGPTGSGKTTTLHSALGYLNKPETKIWTAEDPVEITQYGLRQVQVHPKIGLDFAAAMRSFLRADPDVIMVGEMRDKETCEIGIEASLTGHLVLTTLHTNTAVETVVRLLEMGMDPFNFSDALLGVLGQRLARTICKDCKQIFHPAREAYDSMVAGYGEEAFADLGIAYNDAFVLYRGKGCDACKGTGYKGRIALHELLVVTEEIKRLIQTRATVTDMLKLAKEQGMTTLVQDGIIKCLQGWTDYKQVKAVAMK
jgi:type II secretory ATPase GspE/PulE/Tfp pilus assembly ATPase PilB-like protein